MKYICFTISFLHPASDSNPIPNTNTREFRSVAPANWQVKREKKRYICISRYAECLVLDLDCTCMLTLTKITGANPAPRPSTPPPQNLRLSPKLL